MIRLARKERPDMFLLGAGSKYRPDTAGSNGVLWLSLFRDKIDDVMEAGEMSGCCFCQSWL